MNNIDETTCEPMRDNSLHQCRKPYHRKLILGIHLPAAQQQLADGARFDNFLDFLRQNHPCNLILHLGRHLGRLNTLFDIA